MAITIESIPQKFSPVYNDLFFEASSDNIAEPGFSFIFDIYFGAVLQTRHRIPARPSDNHGLLNAMRILESEVTSESLSNLTDTFKVHDEYWKKFTVKIGEEYEVDGVMTTYPDLETTDAIYAINAVFDYLDYISYDDATYLLLSGTKRFLTNAPDQKIRLSEKAWLYTMNDVPTDYDRRQVKTYTSAGVLVNTYNTNNSSFNTDTDSNRFLRVTSGTSQLVSELGGTVFDGVAYYTVQCQKSDGTAISEAKRYDIDSNCTKFTPIRVHFLNKLGGFDSFTFKLLNKKDFTIKSSAYQKNYSEDKATSDRLTATSSTTVKEGLLVYSDYLSEAEALWLNELYTSPVIFQELNGSLIALKCVETKFEEKKKVNERLFNIRMNFDYTYINQRQRY